MTSNDQEPNSPKTPAGVWLIIVICGVVLIQIVYGYIVFQGLGPDMAVRGQFGDIFGGVNALFTGLAFAGVIYTILLQRRELELQREELRLNRDELSRSTQAQTDQVTRLQEAADLRALTALLDVYSASLQPFWDSTRELRSRIGYLEAQFESTPVDGSAKTHYREQLKEAYKEYRISESGWTDLLTKHQRLTDRLEQRVEQRIQDESSAQEIE